LAHEDVIEAIVKAVAPYLGENMARAATRDQCRKLGLEPETELGPEQLNGLLERLGKGLNLFVGRDQASRLVEQLRRDLSRQGGAA
jgi:hypothetical protein